jgi:hypothetical protein
VDASPALVAAIKQFEEYITGETLTVELNFGKTPAAAAVVSDEFDGEAITIGLLKA